MPKRNPPSKFARQRGRLIQRARESAKMKPGELAMELGKSRPWVVALENGQIDRIHEPECRVLMDKLGLNPTDLTEDPAMLGGDFLPEASFQARRVGRAWDELPKSMQDYLWAQIEAYRKLVKEQPGIAVIMGTPVPIRDAERARSKE